jgi:hypothetical protein
MLPTSKLNSSDFQVSRAGIFLLPLQERVTPALFKNVVCCRTWLVTLLFSRRMENISRKFQGWIWRVAFHFRLLETQSRMAAPRQMRGLHVQQTSTSMGGKLPPWYKHHFYTKGPFTLESRPWKFGSNTISNPLLDMRKYFIKVHLGPKKKVGFKVFWWTRTKKIWHQNGIM